MIDNLSVAEQDDSAVIAVMRAGADELDSAQQTAEAARDQAWPHKADDTYGLLALHEATLGLPVKPPVGVALRRNAVKAAVQSRKVGSKQNWVRRLDTLLHGIEWHFAVDTPAAGQLTISIPYAPGSYTERQTIALADRVTPAHLQIVLTHFILGFIPTYDYVATHYADYDEVLASFPTYDDLAGLSLV